MTRGVTVLAIALVVAIASWTFGWWAPAMTGVLAGYLLAHERIAPTLTGIGSVLGWTLLLAIDAVAGRLPAVAQAMGNVFGKGPVPLLVLTLLIPLLFGLTGAEIGRWLHHRVLAPAADDAPVEQAA